MGGDQGDPVQGIQGAADALGGEIVNPTLLVIVVQSAGGETGTEDVGGQSAILVLVSRKGTALFSATSFS